MITPLAVLLVLLSGLYRSLATPLPLPMPLALMSPDYSSRFLAQNQSAGSLNLVDRSMYNAGRNSSTGPASGVRSRTGVSSSGEMNRRRTLDTLSGLYGRYSSARDHSNNLKKYAAQSANIEQNDLDFQQNAVSEMTAFDADLLGIKALLAQLGADRGLQNYDPTNDLETLLKNVVNLTKETLKAVDILVYNIPILGPFLGPIVYEIKCLLDEVLDAIENLSDAIINAIGPLLRALIGQASSTACRSGVELLGLCI